MSLRALFTFFKAAGENVFCEQALQPVNETSFWDDIYLPASVVSDTITQVRKRSQLDTVTHSTVNTLMV